MIIRKATIDDVPRMLELAKEFHYATRLRRYALWEDSIESWEAFLITCATPQRASTVAFVAELEGIVEGLLLGVIFPAFWNPRIPVVTENVIWVSEAARNKKVATGLLEALENWAKAHKAMIISAGSTVAYKPKNMQQFLRARGYELDERHYIKHLKTE